MSLVTTRFSEQGDMGALVDLNNKVWHDGNAPAPLHWESPEEYASISPPGSQIVAVLENELCGFLSLRQPLKMLPSNSHVLEIVIAVDDRFRGLGIGMKLLEAAENWGKENGKRKMSLRVMSTNEAAIAFYQKFGFEEQGRLVEEFCINGRYVDDILMYKWI
ncbi:GNAT family N-acetyltransferase [Paenibacillus sp. GCM10027627]|uniref:GNAT family N-acetyltransferase n=1 Tax=unclassified Paenibacillus TaxID=185978 RepID=UPI00362C0C48